jgi:hypothetical protein
MKRIILPLAACFTLMAQGAIAAQNTPIEHPPQIIAARTVPDKAIDDWTDTFFYNVNPKLTRGQKLKPIDHAYIQEWQAIRNAVQDDILVYERVSCGRDTPQFSWILRKHDGEPYPPPYQATTS